MTFLPENLVKSWLKLKVWSDQVRESKRVLGEYSSKAALHGLNEVFEADFRKENGALGQVMGWELMRFWRVPFETPYPTSISVAGLKINVKTNWRQNPVSEIKDNYGFFINSRVLSREPVFAVPDYYLSVILEGRNSEWAYFPGFIARDRVLQITASSVSPSGKPMYSPARVVMYRSHDLVRVDYLLELILERLPRVDAEKVYMDWLEAKRSARTML